ncbi:DUF5916 domain-containing protein [Portibacter marinus]|uniref:DUF5916 domain-containing protein n=1 Tax=Portibacter marinus TaxID=2898660 RepID=UPI001F1B8A6B|nr:DUF5916 domain-containing protein [Portibacter marinus]
MYKLLLLTLLLFSIDLIAQQTPINRTDYQLTMKSIDQKIVVDGVLDDLPWQTAEKTTPFHKVTPIDEGYPISPSEVMMVRNKDHFYVAITCFDTIPGKRPVESLRRDFAFGRNDNFIVFIDTYNDQTNGFAFGISAVGAQWEGIQADGGFVSLNWDTKWKSAVQNYSDRWTAEFEIPYKSIRYKEGQTEWGINFSRLDLKTGQKSAWAPVPRQFQTANLAFTGTLKWDDPLPSRKVNYAAIPYLFTQGNQDFSEGKNLDYKFKAGLDAKVTLSSSLNLDLTLNPDFSQVEVDVQQINLDRFELFFPERRQFFLENSDLFASLGANGNRPFFSRRIGLTNPVLGGARLSGKLGNKARIGLMNIQTGSNELKDASNYTVGVFQQQFSTRSNASFFVVNEYNFNAQGDQSKYNSVTGFDLNLSSADSKWTSKIFFHQSLYQNMQASAFTASGSVLYSTPKLAFALAHSFIGEGYSAKVGFVRRTGVFRLVPEFQYRFFPTNSSLVSHGINIGSINFFDTSYQLLDRTSGISYQFTWADRSTLSFNISEVFIRLQNPFDPTNTGGTPLPAGTSYQYFGTGIGYFSNPRSLVSYSVTAGYGSFFNGTRSEITTEAAYRFQPYGYIGIAATYNDINLPQPYNNANFYLIGPKIDVTFTDKIFLSTFTQFNNQINNLNVNVRFQWRYAPGSDFFIVFTQNTFQDDYVIKDRGLIAKISYWFN